MAEEVIEMQGTDTRVVILDGNPQTLARLAKRLKAEGCQVINVTASETAASMARVGSAKIMTQRAKANTGKNPHAAALGRLGGLVGGAARAASLSPRQRQAIARKAARARWAKASAAGRRARRAA
jgi:hypothetical protein